jgi:uncharacterized membrane protein YccF (DUF307 family)
MRTLLNIICLVLCGWMALLYVIAGLVMCVLIITIRFQLRVVSHNRRSWCGRRSCLRAQLTAPAN